MYETFGARVTGSTVEFRLFLPDSAVDPSQYVRGGDPHIRSVRVVGDFQGELGQAPWDPMTAPELTREAHPNGWLYTFAIPQLADGFYQYKYLVVFENGETRWCGDPCAKYGGDVHENAGFVVVGNATGFRCVEV